MIVITKHRRAGYIMFLKNNPEVIRISNQTSENGEVNAGDPMILHKCEPSTAPWNKLMKRYVI